MSTKDYAHIPTNELATLFVELDKELEQRQGLIRDAEEAHRQVKSQHSEVERVLCRRLNDIADSCSAFPVGDSVVHITLNNSLLRRPIVRLDETTQEEQGNVG